MQIEVLTGNLRAAPSDIAIIGQFEEGGSKEALSIDRTLKGTIQELRRSGEFSGKFMEFSLLHLFGKPVPRRLLLVGLGSQGRFDLERVRQIMGKAASRIREMALPSFSASLLGAGLVKLNVRDCAQAMAEGAILGTYRFTQFKTDPSEQKTEPREFRLVVDESLAAQVQRGVNRGRIIAEATNYARDLCNSPSNILTPSVLVREAEALATEFGLRLQVFERQELEQMGMGAFMGVARGTAEPPKLIVLEFDGAKRAGKPVALVGKSVTFDSGGISLKPAEKMEQMKYDMSGGAAVLGTIRAAAQLKLPVNLVGVLPATDNMPGGSAIHPGDVVKSLSGKTIEVINTDAEGRLCLADALTYVTRYNPSAVIDLATLTGACVVALGQHAIGLLTNNSKLAGKIHQAGEETGERTWELPLWPEYEEQIKSDVADLKNVGGRPAGTITAAAFLRHFTGDFPWVHLDIAGTAWNEQDRPYVPKGSTGIGVRLLIQFLTDYVRTSS